MRDLDLQAGDLRLVGACCAPSSPRRRAACGSTPRAVLPPSYRFLLMGFLPPGLPPRRRRARPRGRRRSSPGRSAARTPARSSSARTSACSSAMPKAMPAAGEVGADLLQHRGGGAVDLDDGAGVEHQPAGAGRHARRRSRRSRACTWSALKKSRLALDQADREPGHRPGVRAAVQLVEAVPAGDAAEHRVARIHHLAQAGRRRSRRWRSSRRSAPRGRSAPTSRSSRRRTPSG